MSLKFGLIGSGMMGCEHIRNLAHVDGVDLVSVADPSERSREWALQACGDRFTPETYADYRHLLDQELDAVIIASPNFTHIDIMRDVASTPLHVLLEKPMCTTVEDSRELVRMSEARTGLVWVALEYRYMSATTQFLNRLPETGDLKMLFIREHRFPFLKKVNDWNRFNEFTGGTLIEKCCHFFDLMNHATGATPVSVMASGAMDVNHIDERYDGRQPDILDNAFVIIEYANGMRGCLDLCMFAEGSRNEQELVATGSKAKLEVHIPDNRLTLSHRENRETEICEIEDDPRIRHQGFHHGASYLEQVDFVEAIMEGKPAGVSTVDGYWSVAVGAAAQQSIDTGERCDVEPLVTP